MKITILGCGPSGGVPLIGRDWGACNSNEERNQRLRASILVEEGSDIILVDTSPDLRAQALACNLRQLSAVLFTHAHADHCHGIDELRSLTWKTQKPVDAYGDAETMSELEERFRFVFHGDKNKIYKPIAKAHIIDGPFEIGSIRVTPFVQQHGGTKSLGFRFNNFAYSTDVKTLDETAFAALEGIHMWVVDCLREAEHPTHSHLAQTLSWIERVKPARTWLTHMNASLDYDKLSAILPPGVAPAYDGLVIEC